MNVLPDSRLRDPKATVMADVRMTDGTTRRMEMEPIYCFQCGKPNGYVPSSIMSFVSWLCMPCSEKWGELASTWMVSDQVFWDKVNAEMLDQFGRILTQAELEEAVLQGRLGTALELLERESPYRGG